MSITVIYHAMSLTVL